MIPDLFLPIMFIVIMYVIIGFIEDALTLLAVGSLFIPVSIMFAQIVNSGGYTTMFGATLITGSIGTPLISGSMFMIPLFAITKIFYLRHISGRDSHE